MHSPAPNIPGATSPFTASPFTEYMKELETSLNDICELDKKLDVKFAREDSLIHALSVVGQHWQARQRRRKEVILPVKDHPGRNLQQVCRRLR
jgi:hypothetical protein